MYKFINLLLAVITKRISLITINVLTFFFSIYCIHFLYEFILTYNRSYNHETIDEVSDIINSIAGVLVAFGVLLESRETIHKMTRTKSNELEQYLNLVAEHNGMGLLLIGLFMEIITLILYLPNRFINTKGVEHYLIIISTLLIIISMVVEIDLVKDYTLTFFKKPGPEKLKQFEKE